MAKDVYSPHTFEHIKTDRVMDWMGRAGVDAPEYEAGKSCFWNPEIKAWEIHEAGEPEVMVPQQVTRFQAKAALLEAGLLSAVEEYVNKDDTSALIKLAYAEALHFERDSQFISALGPLLGLTDAQIDELFIKAATIA